LIFACYFGFVQGYDFRRGDVEDFAGFVEGVVDVFEHVLFAELVEEAVFGEGEEGLGVYAGEEEACVLAFAFVVEFLEGVYAGGVDGGDSAHAEDEDFWGFGDAAEGVFEFVGDTEEEGAVDFVDFDAGWDVAGEDGVGVGMFVGIGGNVLIEFSGDDVEVCDFGHAFHEEDDGEAHADADGDGQVGQDGEGEGGEEDEDVGFWGFEE